MTIKIKKMTVLVLLFTLAFSLVTYSKTYSRNITAWFNNIQVVLDGKALNLSSEPFIFDNKVYVPIEELSDSLYVNVAYDEEGKKLSINTNRPYASDSNLPIAYQKENELFYLKAQVEELKNELEILKGGRYPYSDIKTVADMEKYLNENFKKIENINTSIKFSGLGGDRYRLTVEFKYRDITEWNLMDRRDIEVWVDDLFYTVRELFNENAVIEGLVKHDSTIHQNQIVAYYTRGDRLYYDFTRAAFKESQEVDGVKLEKELAQRLKNYNYLTFNYEVYVTQNDDVDLFVTPSQDDFFEWTPSMKMQYLKRLRTEVQKVYPNVYVNGKVKDAVDVFRFGVEGDTISSVDLLNETEDYLNTKYKSFIFIETFAFKYTLTEGHSNNFQINLEGNFSKHDAAWDEAKTYAHNSFTSMIRGAFNYVNEVWNVDIFGEVVDENGESICDLEYYSTSPYGFRSLQPILYK